MKSCLIITGGEFSPIPEDIDFEYVYACDLGYDNACRLGITPDFVIGDFDSLDGDAADRIGSIPSLSFPTRKDDTDTMLAIRHAISSGFTHIIIACALGGRLDHTIANIQSMAFAASYGVKCEIMSASDHLITMLPGELHLPKVPGMSLSLFALSDKCSGISLVGTAYDCSDVTIGNTFPIGVSNKWVSEEAVIKLKNGILLIVESRIS